MSTEVARNPDVLSWPRSSLKAWLVCTAAGLFFFYEFFQLNLFDVINQPLRRDFNLNASQISWMSSTYLWADILFLLPAGIILDWFSPRRVILFSMLLCILSTIGLAVTEVYSWACFYHFISGIGNAFCFLSCIVLVSHWFPPRRQALVIGTLVTMAFLGGMMAHTPFAWISESYGWRSALYIDALVGVMFLIWIFIIVEDQPYKNKNTSAVVKPKPNFLKAFCNPQNWLAGLYTSFLNLPIMVLCALWGSSYLQVVHQLSELTASNIVSLILMGSIVGCPLVGFLSDYHGRRKPIMIVGALITLLLEIPLLTDTALSTTTLSLLFFSLGFITSTQVISYPLIAESNSSTNTGVATSIASVLIMGGAGVAQVLFGFLVQHHAKTVQTVQTVYATADFQYAMWIFPITAVAALICVLLTSEPNRQIK